MMKARFLFYMACLLVGVLTATCSDDALDEFVSSGYGVDKNCMLKVTVPFQMKQGMSAHIVTRAGITPDQLGKDSQVSGIMVYVFENNGGAPENDKRVNWQLFGMPGMTVEGETDKLVIPDKNDLTKGYFELFIPKGNVYIYLIANAKGSFVDFFGNVGTSQLKNRKDFLDLVRPSWLGSLYAIDGYMPMCGMVNNNSGACTVEVDPHNSNLGILKYVDYNGTLQTIGTTFSPQSSFVLKRLMCRVSMNFVEGAGITFTPKNFRFYHCAQQIAPVVDQKGYAIHAGAKFDPPTVDTETIPFSAQTPMSFVVYLPENVREYTGQKALTSFAERDKVKKDANGKNMYETHAGHTKHYIFENAPAKSTYVEVTGHLENKNTKRSADVRYLIHLGDFSNATDANRFHHFSLRRDWQYHYTVTVNGVEDIKVEVETGQEKNPAVEGVVFEGGARLHLDAHYEQVEMKFNRAQLEKGIYVYAKTPYGIVNCKYLPASGQLDPTHANLPKTLQEAQKLLQWVSFRRQQTRGQLAPYFKGGNPATVFDALKEAYQQGGDSYYTCFVDEYYYEKDPVTGGATELKQFINAEDRTFSLGSDIQYSIDGQSAVSHAVYMLQQRSIACFYDLDNLSVAKYGMEQVDEIADLLQQGKLVYGRPAATSADAKDGRGNTLKEIGPNTGVVDWSQNGFLLKDATGSELIPGNARLRTKEAHLACLTRNRDFNGDGQITAEELRWYTPARDQMLGLWIGEPAMPAEAAIYPHPTSMLTGSSETCQYPVFTSTNDNSRVIYAEQGSTFGDINSAPNGGYIRAVRNLGRVPLLDSYRMKADPYYKYNPQEGTIEVFLTKNALRAYTERELAPHHERSAVNRLYRKFQVAKHPCVKQDTVTCNHPFTGSSQSIYEGLQVTGAVEAKTRTITIASAYAGSGEVACSTAEWRLPNQREMALMVVALGAEVPYDKNKYSLVRKECNGWLSHRWVDIKNYALHCRTSFSKEGYTKYGYMYNVKDSKMQFMHVGSDLGVGQEGTAAYFCVRDVK